MAFRNAPPPKTLLGRYRSLAPSASVKVSPICLGAMSFGEAHAELLGKVDKETTFSILDAFYDMGGNFIDTANNYQNEQSESWLGEWMAKKGNRDQMVIATKYTTNYQAYKGFDGRINANYGGNNAKSLHVSVAASLKKLQTDYIDVLYVHWWDMTTSIEETMLSLNALIQQGKVLYLGASDLPAYVVSKANQYARDHGLHPFVVYQGQWSAMNRDLERDILHMTRDEGMGLAPWGALGGGNFKTKAQREEKQRTGEGRKAWQATPAAEKVSAVLEGIAERKKTALTSVALAYVMHKAPYVFPICGGRKVEHLKGNVEALALQLSPEEMKEIDGAYGFDIGFPFAMFGTRPEDNFLNKIGAHYDYVQPQLPIRPGGETLE